MEQDDQAERVENQGGRQSKEDVPGTTPAIDVPMDRLFPLTQLVHRFEEAGFRLGQFGGRHSIRALPRRMTPFPNPRIRLEQLAFRSEPRLVRRGEFADAQSELRVVLCQPAVFCAKIVRRDRGLIQLAARGDDVSRPDQPGLDFLDREKRPPHGVQHLNGRLAAFALLNPPGQTQDENG